MTNFRQELNRKTKVAVTPRYRCVPNSRRLFYREDISKIRPSTNVPARWFRLNAPACGAGHVLNITLPVRNPRASIARRVIHCSKLIFRFHPIPALLVLNRRRLIPQKYNRVIDRSDEFFSNYSRDARKTLVVKRKYIMTTLGESIALRRYPKGEPLRVIK